jgi:5-bromo-4-chloroindolyl phosphate hydrolysis protein
MNTAMSKFTPKGLTLVQIILTGIVSFLVITASFVIKLWIEKEKKNKKLQAEKEAQRQENIEKSNEQTRETIKIIFEKIDKILEEISNKKESDAEKNGEIKAEIERLKLSVSNLEKEIEKHSRLLEVNNIERRKKNKPDEKNY